MNRQKGNLIRDLGIIVFSIFVAVVLVKTGAVEYLLANAEGSKFLGSFLAGLFFVSIFTVVPAAVVLIEIAKINPVWEVALIGGAGALAGDFIIFQFVRDNLVADIRWLVQKTKQERLVSIFHLKLFRWLVPFVGALVIASPLPDEIGLAMMGLSKMKTAAFIPVSFLLNFLGILIIGLMAKLLI
ncbi:MAG: hypothetical protein HY432_03810 [Candidatus Liptonbacteria bacterium]|nr:hypothetical protein [Candidatus Liptonbacteria bacterium]